MLDMEQPQYDEFEPELEDLRQAALTLLDHCLTDGVPDDLLDFIDYQLVQQPPPLRLLQALAGDIHHRLIGLRADLFNVRDQFLRQALREFQVDLSLFAPPQALHEYHAMTSADLMTFIRGQKRRLTAHERRALQQSFEASTRLAHQLNEDVLLAEDMLLYVVDWMDGLSITVVRQGWIQSALVLPPTTRIH
jgi:hypothetical protein